MAKCDFRESVKVVVGCTVQACDSVPHEIKTDVGQDKAWLKSSLPTLSKVMVRQLLQISKPTTAKSRWLKLGKR
jgi:hypothetical protein